MYHIILAGGSGTRFWPMSTDENPKQFLKIVDDLSLIKTTYNRLLRISSEDKIFIVSSKKYVNKINNEISSANIIIEPSPKNTAPAIYLVAKHIFNLDNKAKLAFYPSDHYIQDQNNFIQTVQCINEFLDVNHDAILSIGIQPNYAATGYGYISYNEDINPSENIYKVDLFTEKPNSIQAEELIQKKSNLWNAGMFFFYANTIIKEIEKYNFEFQKNNNINDDWDNFPNISIDYAVMEKTDKCYCIRGDFMWSDVGSWKTLYELLEKNSDNNVISGESILYNSKNNLIISPNKVTAVVGLDNIAVINIDETTLVIDLDKSDDLKELVKKIANNKNY